MKRKPTSGFLLYAHAEDWVDVNETVDMGREANNFVPSSLRIFRPLGLTSTFAPAAAAVLTLTMNMVMPESFGKARLAPVLVGLALLHLMRFERIQINREMTLYGIFVFYMFVELLLTDNMALARNTLPVFRHGSLSASSPGSSL